MGAIGVIGAVYSAYSEYDQNKSYNKNLEKEQKYKYNSMIQHNNNNKNLLNEQLAKRRSILGVSNTTNSSSSLAAQERMVSDTAKNINVSEMNYQSQAQDKQYSNNLLNSVLSSTSKLLK